MSFTEDEKTLLSGFGVRAGSRKWMIEKLSEIWDASHEPSKALPLGKLILPVVK